MVDKISPVPLLRTKLHRPPVVPDLIQRDVLYDRLEAGRHLPLTIVSAPAGYGKSTLISHWLEQSGHPAAWVSLDENDNNLRIFLAYLLAAVQTIFPEAGQQTKSFVTEDVLPPASVIANVLINDLDPIAQPIILALDDYYRIHNTAVHEFMERILEHPPSAVHMVIMTRYNPPLQLSSLRAKRKLTEIKTDTLQFTLHETSAYLAQSMGWVVDKIVVEKLHRRTEGWPVGIGLASMVMQDHHNVEAFISDFENRSHQIEDYLIKEVLSHQPADLSTWLMQTAILDRFNAALCQAVCGTGEEGTVNQMNGTSFIQELRLKGLFYIALDDRREWYRYHHLFQSLLNRQLKANVNDAEITALHQRAADWFESQGFIEEALSHCLALEDPHAVGQLILRNRHQITQKEQWHRLNYLMAFLPPEVLYKSPEMLILKAWAYDSRGRITEEHRILNQVEPMVNDLAPGGYKTQLLGEIAALRSMKHYEYAADGPAALRLANRALELLPAEFISERAHATIMKAVSLQMTGDLNGALEVIYSALQEKECANTIYHGRLLLTLCFIHWMAANLIEMRKTSTIMLAVGMDNDLPETTVYAHYFQGIGHYHANELKNAHESLAYVVSEQSITNVNAYIRCSQALALTYQAMGEPQKAKNVAEGVIERLLKTANTYYLPTMQAFMAKLALRQGRLPEAVQWADSVEVGTPQQAYAFFIPELTVVKIQLRQATPEALQQAELILDDFLPFFERTHNTRWIIEILALKALLHSAQGDESAALSCLKRSITLARPGGFVRLFIDLGPELAGLLYRLELDHEELHFAGRLLAAFKTDKTLDTGQSLPSPNPARSSQPLIEPLTLRELEILSQLARHKSNKEIAEKLIISIGTVKAHASNIYHKLGVHRRKEAVAKASGLGLLKPEKTPSSLHSR